jgi:hypothetical protein
VDNSLSSLAIRSSDVGLILLLFSQANCQLDADGVYFGKHMDGNSFGGQLKRDVAKCNRGLAKQ